VRDCYRTVRGRFARLQPVTEAFTDVAQQLVDGLYAEGLINAIQTPEL